MQSRRQGKSPGVPADTGEKPPSPASLKILKVVRRIPRGHVATYGQIARLAGLPGRARLVGHTLGHSPLADGVPWHRVVNAAGRISERKGCTRQRELLAAEGITLDPSGRIDMAQYQWSANSLR